MTKGFWISLDYATFGVLCKGEIVIEAAPIASWMIGKSLKEIKPFLLKRRAIVQELNL
jgi:hypothetical protein